MKSKITTIILIISLTINLIVIGAMVGFWLREPMGPRFPVHLGNILDKVNPEQRRQMKREFRQYREESRSLHREMRHQQRSLSKIILTEPFDEQAAEQAFSQTREARNEVQAHMHEQMIEVMSKLDRKQRAELMRRLLRENFSRPQKHSPPEVD